MESPYVHSHHGLAQYLAKPPPHAGHSGSHDTGCLYHDLFLGIDRRLYPFPLSIIWFIPASISVTRTASAWPVLDLFTPFAPQRIDRDYKPGIDAIRVTVPLSDFSEIEIVTAGQGDNMPQDLSYAAMGRWNIANSDIALMAGRFHEDTVIAGFFTTDYAGVGYRLEVAHTESGDELDKQLDRRRFWRATAGFDYQINPDVTWVTELAWNEYGAKRADEYLKIIIADRFSRGEITSFGRAYVGSSLNWQFHPLVNASVAVLHKVVLLR
ncbi:hypothetical protein HBA55_36330 [Pseudomaricurvus alkylphenolicus]|uniref:hypothetical protein n=1 Tax=Pseudomaricurvus alkylphenolicus TaxID=1306991 RepID=UPI00141E0C4A|nr:hypothetical protein [Pseudomaricurvus alkylphenolicus]NIB45103.1 hypothetical protein [Pseudomaricurvus alkylphenolicus]